MLSRSNSFEQSTYKQLNVYDKIYTTNEVCIDMKVEIWSDFVSPLCYIAKRKFEIALQKFEQKQYVKVEFKSFLLHKEERASNYSCEELLMETCNVSISQLDDWLRRVYGQAKKLNLPLNLEGFAWTNTRDAHRLVKFATTIGKDKELVDSLFNHFFSLKDKTKHNINDKNVLLKIACNCGLDRNEVSQLLSIKKYNRAIELDEDDAREIGIEDVPFFIFNEKYALVGNQPVDVFLEALKESWKEDEERLLKRQTKCSNETSYCEGDDCGM